MFAVARVLFKVSRKRGLARALIALGTALALAPPAYSRGQSTTSSVASAVLVETKLDMHGKVSLFMGAVGVVVPAGEISNLSTVADGVLYEMSGATEVTVDGVIKNLGARQAAFIAAGKRVTLKAGTDIPSTLMHFLLGRATELSRSGASPPATVIDVFRTPGPIPNLKPGKYDLNLTAVTFPPHTPSNASRHRSGSALNYVLAGAGTTTVGGETTQKEVGSVVYEPPGLVPEWGNPGDVPLRIVVFNISPEGVPTVNPGGPVKPR